MAPRRPAAPQARSTRPSAQGSGTTNRVTGSPAPRTSSRGSGARTSSARGTTTSGGQGRGSSRPATGATPRVRRTSGGRRAAGRVAGMVPETITTRTLVLAGAILLAFVILLPTAREYVTQSADLRALHADLAATEQQKADAQAALDRFQDPAFLKAEARLRLGYMMPGDKAYRVIDPGDANQGVSSITGKPVSAGVVEREGDAADPWYRTMWTSVQVAGTGVTTDSK